MMNHRSLPWHDHLERVTIPEKALDDTAEAAPCQEYARKHQRENQKQIHPMMQMKCFRRTWDGDDTGTMMIGTLRWR